MSGGITDDQKVSLKLKNRNSSFIDFTGILSPLSQTNGIVFPYSPTIGIGHSANYGSYDTPHSIYQPSFYVNTQNPTIGLTAQFTANSIDEAKHTAACLQFLKSLTKSDYGIQAGADAGMPPPVCMFSAYGYLHAKAVPVIVTSVNYNLTEDVDYVQVGDFSVPTSLLVTIDLRVQHTPRNVRDNFNARDYASGNLLKNNKGFM